MMVLKTNKQGYVPLRNLPLQETISVYRTVLQKYESDFISDEAFCMHTNQIKYRTYMCLIFLLSIQALLETHLSIQFILPFLLEEHSCDELVPVFPKTIYSRWLRNNENYSPTYGEASRLHLRYKWSSCLGSQYRKMGEIFSLETIKVQ